MWKAVAWAAPLLAAAGILVVSGTAASGPPAPQAPAGLTAAMRASVRLAHAPLMMTSATFDQTWYAPKHPGPVRRLLAGWLAHARPTAVVIPPLRRPIVVLNAYVGPAILYVGWGPGQVTIKPACYFVAGPGQSFSIRYLAGIAALTQYGHTTYWKAPALVRWMQAGQWLPLFTLATPADFPTPSPRGPGHARVAGHAERL